MIRQYGNSVREMLKLTTHVISRFGNSKKETEAINMWQVVNVLHSSGPSIKPIKNRPKSNSAKNSLNIQHLADNSRKRSGNVRFRQIFGSFRFTWTFFSLVSTELLSRNMRVQINGIACHILPYLFLLSRTSTYWVPSVWSVDQIFQPQKNKQYEVEGVCKCHSRHTSWPLSWVSSTTWKMARGIDSNFDYAQSKTKLYLIKRLIFCKKSFIVYIKLYSILLK